MLAAVVSFFGLWRVEHDRLFRSGTIARPIRPTKRFRLALGKKDELIEEKENEWGEVT